MANTTALAILADLTSKSLVSKRKILDELMQRSDTENFNPTVYQGIDTGEIYSYKSIQPMEQPVDIGKYDVDGDIVFVCFYDNKESEFSSFDKLLQFLLENGCVYYRWVSRNEPPESDKVVWEDEDDEGLLLGKDTTKVSDISKVVMCDPSSIITSVDIAQGITSIAPI